MLAARLRTSVLSLEPTRQKRTDSNCPDFPTRAPWHTMSVTHTYTHTLKRLVKKGFSGKVVESKYKYAVKEYILKVY